MVWLTGRYIGRLLKRLGFITKRRVGSGTEYFLKVSDVKDMALRLGIGTAGEDSEISEVNNGRESEE